jgi:hypothetical protein
LNLATSASIIKQTIAIAVDFIIGFLHMFPVWNHIYPARPRRKATSRSAESLIKAVRLKGEGLGPGEQSQKLKDLLRRRQNHC